MCESRDNLQHRTDMLDAQPDRVAAGSPTHSATRAPAWLEQNINQPARGHEFRDIRADLEQRARLLDEQIKAAQAEFETMIEQLQEEHAARLKDLRSELDAVNLLIGFEERRNMTPSTKPHLEQS